MLLGSGDQSPPISGIGLSPGDHALTKPVSLPSEMVSSGIECRLNMPTGDGAESRLTGEELELPGLR